jgi:hypothetical protein
MKIFETLVIFATRGAGGDDADDDADDDDNDE